jgi:dihydrofolate synthase/folylpolyglutamate synthase
MIGKREIARLVERLKPIIEEYNRISQYGPLTFFEVYTALAFLYFSEKKVDYAVLETGLGGRLDATNTVNPLVCGITPISYDHMVQLGSTLREIAKEKAGIIKSHRPLPTLWPGQAGKRLTVVSAGQDKEAGEVIKNSCREKGARLCEAGKDIAWKNKRLKDGFQMFDVQSAKAKYRNLKIRLLGGHQLDNAVLAIGMVETLCDEKITPFAIKEGLQKAVWPGRLELISKAPHILLDGAQNIVSAQALKEAVKSYFRHKKIILVMGISKDKDIRRVGNTLCIIADKIILTKAKCPRAAEPEHIQKILDVPAQLTRNVAQAIRLAKRMAGSKDLILVTGSLFVVGEARRYVKKHVD